MRERDEASKAQISCTSAFQESHLNIQSLNKYLNVYMETRNLILDFHFLKKYISVNKTCMISSV